MRKIPTLFVRDQKTRLVTPAVNPECVWVAEGHGTATRKLDGSCCLVRGGKLFKRYEVKPGGTPPPGFEPANEVDEVTGKQQGWLPVGDGPEDRWHREAWADSFEICVAHGVGDASPPEDGTYELCGPKVQGNPEKLPCHALLRHGSSRTMNCTASGGPVELPGVPRDFDGLREYLRTHDVEGVVWWHPDGRMAKVKGKDYGLRRGKGDAHGS